MNRAVFLDRDGTINFDENGYISDPNDFELFPNAAKAVKLLNDNNYLVFVVTNQSGIARGYFNMDDVEKIHSKMIFELNKTGAHIDDIFVSPYHEEGKIEPYNIDHKDRKPGMGLFEKALKKYELQVNQSYMIGDKASDIIFGNKAHLKSILVLTGNGKETFKKVVEQKKVAISKQQSAMSTRKSEQETKSEIPNYVCTDILTAVELIIKLKNKDKH